MESTRKDLEKRWSSVELKSVQAEKVNKKLNVAAYLLAILDGVLQKKVEGSHDRIL